MNVVLLQILAGMFWLGLISVAVWSVFVNFSERLRCKECRTVFRSWDSYEKINTGGTRCPECSGDVEKLYEGDMTYEECFKWWDDKCYEVMRMGIRDFWYKKTLGVLPWEKLQSPWVKRFQAVKPQFAGRYW